MSYKFLFSVFTLHQFLSLKLYFLKSSRHVTCSFSRAGLCCLHTRNTHSCTFSRFCELFISCRSVAGPRSLLWIGLIQIDLSGRIVGGVVFSLQEARDVGLSLFLWHGDAQSLDSSVHWVLQNGDIPSFLFHLFLGNLFERGASLWQLFDYLVL